MTPRTANERSFLLPMLDGSLLTDFIGGCSLDISTIKVTLDESTSHILVSLRNCM